MVIDGLTGKALPTMAERGIKVGDFVRYPTSLMPILVDRDWPTSPFAWGVNARGESECVHFPVTIEGGPVAVARWIRGHCLSNIARRIIDSRIWPDVADELLVIARKSRADALNLGFPDGVPESGDGREVA